MDIRMGDVWRIDGAEWCVLCQTRDGGLWLLSGPGPCRGLRTETPEVITAGALVSRVSQQEL